MQPVAGIAQVDTGTIKLATPQSILFCNYCTVHFDICRAHSPTDPFLFLKSTLKFTLKYT